MGLQTRARAAASAFSLGIYNTDEEVDYLLKHLPRVIAEVARDSPDKPQRTRVPATCRRAARFDSPFRLALCFLPFMNAKPHVAIVGATGAVGIEMIKTLEKRNFPVGKLTLLASARSGPARN
jgi:hypothetical protein